MNYGDLGKRIVAAIIDSVIRGLIGTIIYALFWVMSGGNPFAIGAMFAVGSGVVIVADWLYIILLEGGSWHATLGKRIMSLYVVGEDGRGISYSTAILRTLGKYLSGMIFGIGYIMGLFNNEKQCLHDMIARTYVVEGTPMNSIGINRGYGRRSKPVRGQFEAMPEIVGVSGPLAGMIYQIDENGLLLGRDTISCQVVLPSSQGRVSRNHCFVTYNPMSGMFVLNDRNSTHGTYLANGTRVHYSQPAALKSGDRFYLATPDNTFEVR